MKTEIHPEYVEAHVRCTCGNEFTTRSTQSEIHVEICSNCHPFYTGKQKLVDTGGRVERFQRRAAKRQPAPSELARTMPVATDLASPSRRTAPARSRGSGAPTRDAPVGGQAVLEGVMMRGVRNWAVAVRKPAPEQLDEEGARIDAEESADGEIAVQTFPLESVLKRHRAAAAADRARRRRARRIADDRLQGARHLGQRAAARGGGADLRRHVGGDDRRRARARRRPLLPRPGRR